MSPVYGAGLCRPCLLLAEQDGAHVFAHLAPVRVVRGSAVWTVAGAGRHVDDVVIAGTVHQPERTNPPMNLTRRHQLGALDGALVGDGNEGDQPAAHLKPCRLYHASPSSSS